MAKCSHLCPIGGMSCTLWALKQYCYNFINSGRTFPTIATFSESFSNQKTSSSEQNEEGIIQFVLFEAVCNRCHVILLYIASHTIIYSRKTGFCSDFFPFVIPGYYYGFELQKIFNYIVVQRICRRELLFLHIFSINFLF